MKNLENYGVLEMDIKDSKETDGGIGILAAIGIGIAVFMITAYIVDNAARFAEGVSDGYNAV